MDGREQIARFRLRSVLTLELTERYSRGAPMPLFYLLFGLYGLLLLATPFLAIALYVRNSKLRQQLNELAEENAKQHTKLQRAIGELQTKIGATASPATPAAERPVAPDIRQPSPVPVP